MGDEDEFVDASDSPMAGSSGKGGGGGGGSAGIDQFQSAHSVIVSKNDDDDDDDDGGGGGGTVAVESVPEGITSEILDDNMDRGVRLFFDNEFQNAEMCFRTYCRSDPLHSTSFAALGYLKYLMSFSDKDLHEAEARVKYAQELCSSLLKRESRLAQIGRVLRGGEKPPLTATEMSAAICLAEAYVLSAELAVLNESISSLVKAGMDGRRSLALFNQCYDSIKQVGVDKYDKNALSGVLLGQGALNYTISLLPEKLIGVANFIGLSGDRDVGEDLLQKALATDGVRSPLAALALTAFNVLVPSFFNSPSVEKHVNVAETILRAEMSKFPKSAVHFWMLGRLLRMKKDLTGSVKAFEDGIAAQSQLRQLHHVSYYELGISALISLEYEKPFRYFSILADESEWSKAFNCYIAALSLHCKSGASPAELAQALELFKKAPTLIKKVFAGKTISVEQYVRRKVATYCSGDKALLFLPQLEIIYFWNGFSQQPREVLQKSLKIVEESGLPSSLPAEHQAAQLLYKGVILKWLERTDEATQLLTSGMSFIEGLHKTGKLKEELWILPHLYFELGSLAMVKGLYPEAIKYFKMIDSVSADYNFKWRLSFRVHMSVDSITRSKK